MARLPSWLVVDRTRRTGLDVTVDFTIRTWHPAAWRFLYWTARAEGVGHVLAIFWTVWMMARRMTGRRITGTVRSA